MKVSVNILEHNDSKYFAACLRSCYEQDYKNLDILVINDVPENMSRCEEIIDEVQTGRKIIRLLNIQKTSLGLARKMGVNESNADVIAFIDSDTVLSSTDWITKMIAPFEDPGVAITHTLGTYHQHDPAIMRYAILATPYREGQRPGTGHTLIRKSTILKYGNFQDVKGNEDRLLIDKFTEKIVYMPDLRVYHYHATTLWQFLYKTWRVKCTSQEVGKINPHYYYNDRSASDHRERLIKYNTKQFFRALIGEEDPAWLLWPVVGFCQLMIFRVVYRVVKYG
jgi:glycosyltransferase involved in cell wall biosynthesis